MARKPQLPAPRWKDVRLPRALADVTSSALPANPSVGRDTAMREIRINTKVLKHGNGYRPRGLAHVLGHRACK